MGFFSKIFKRQKKEKAKEIREDFKPTHEEVEEFDSMSLEDYPICHSCGLRIIPPQKVTTFNGEKYHVKPCFKKLRKEARKS